jgi:hypothetical protein
MAKLIALSMTDAELETLDWLVKIEEAPSRSELIRRLLIWTARQRGLSPFMRHLIAEEREACRPRRSRLLTSKDRPKKE